MCKETIKAILIEFKSDKPDLKIDLVPVTHSEAVEIRTAILGGAKFPSKDSDISVVVGISSFGGYVFLTRERSSTKAA